MVLWLRAAVDLLVRSAFSVSNGCSATLRLALGFHIGAFGRRAVYGGDRSTKGFTGAVSPPLFPVGAERGAHRCNGERQPLRDCGAPSPTLAANLGGSSIHYGFRPRGQDVPVNDAEGRVRNTHGQRRLSAGHYIIHGYLAERAEWAVSLEWPVIDRELLDDVPPCHRIARRYTERQHLTAVNTLREMRRLGLIGDDLYEIVHVTATCLGLWRYPFDPRRPTKDC